ncbi:type 1 glutamine amidotransferase domain-containing protein [Xylella fastidiosa subsp. multiplex]|uniref:type 1 glutamine amidotransferase domain-containing protein n=1 Tax=Xylella fastidiosa TaxID=2371 RepID=UPI00235F16AE|nr:type 1 glutamine amidotransferase domain-containing protein [Xylella fastidiosa]MDD0926730.1 type 1 glutamine amidotransferase domain-containing protein [Xylella fastidiosa subsp. multiplex]
MTNNIKPILCVVTSHPIRGDSGEPTGFAMVELTHPLEVFEAAGIPVEIASIRGGHPPIDFFDLSDPVNDRFWKNKAFRHALAHSFVLGDLDPLRYSAVFFVGGHGTMWDFADSLAVQNVIRGIWGSDGIVSAVCHGPAALVNATLSDGSYLVAGKKVAAFTDEEETEVKYANVVPYLLATTLKQRGALHQSAPNWVENVVVDGRLITGQNPASAYGVGQRVVDQLKASI